MSIAAQGRYRRPEIRNMKIFYLAERRKKPPKTKVYHCNVALLGQHRILVQTSPCALKNFPCALKAKSQITPLRRVMFAINTTTTQCRVCFNQKRFGFFCALWVKAHFALRDLGQIMKIRSTDLSGKWC